MEGVGSALSAAALNKGGYAQDTLAEFALSCQPVADFRKHQPSEKLNAIEAQFVTDKQEERQVLRSGANTGPRGTSPPKKSTPVKQDQGLGAVRATEEALAGARLKRTFATAPFFVTDESDVHLMVRVEPAVVHEPREAPEVMTI